MLLLLLSHRRLPLVCLRQSSYNEPNFYAEMVFRRNPVSTLSLITVEYIFFTPIYEII